MGPHIISGPQADQQATRAALDAIRRIVRWLRVSSRAAERDVGLSAAQLFVLSRLASGPAPSLNELAERTLTHQSSASVVVSRLVAGGYVRRTRSETDGRRQELRLTPRGQRLLRRAPNTPQDRLVEALHRMSPGDRASLARLLEKFTQLAAIDEPPEMFFEESNPTQNRKTHARTHR